MKLPAVFLAGVIAASTVHAENAAIYDANPEHPWNRLSAALHTDTPAAFLAPAELARQMQIGKPYDDAVIALDDFLAHHYEKKIATPVKRALLQSELWATFDDVADATGGEQVKRKEIARRCAAIIQRLALSETEIAGLPDTYAFTVKNRVFPTAYDSAHAQNAFLPPDLLDESGPWVMLSSSDFQPAAIQHVKATQGRAVFYVLIHLPAGRQATIAYLKRLAEFPQPYVWDDSYAQFPYARSPVKFNRDLPQFPPGTQVALVRRMLLTTSTGELVVTPITESIQLRVYAKEPKEVGFDTVDAQNFYELRLVPDELFKGGGGLRERKGERPDSRLIFTKATLFSMGGCQNCHGSPGVLSLNTYTHLFGPRPNTPWFEPSSVAWQNTHTLNWKKRDYTWGLLSALLDSR